MVTWLKNLRVRKCKAEDKRNRKRREIKGDFVQAWNQFMKFNLELEFLLIVVKESSTGAIKIEMNKSKNTSVEG